MYAICHFLHALAILNIKVCYIVPCLDNPISLQYGPHVSSQKTSLWDRLAGLMNRMNGAWCIFGDLNVVRRGEDRMNSQVNVREMNEFNDFINITRLVEVPMGGRKHTRVSDDDMKFSKLDRFLLNEDFSNIWGNLSVVALDRKLSDHCPIVIKDV